MLAVFGGKIDALRTFLLEERIPDGWAPWNASRFGITASAVNMAVVKLMIKIKTMSPKKTSTSNVE
jgi:hypothetical protein